MQLLHHPSKHVPTYAMYMGVYCITSKETDKLKLCSYVAYLFVCSPPKLHLCCIMLMGTNSPVYLANIYCTVFYWLIAVPQIVAALG